MKVHYKKSQYITRQQEERESHTCRININKIFNYTTANRFLGNTALFDSLEPRSVMMISVVSLAVN